MKLWTSVLFLSVLIISCSESTMPEEKMFPSDYLFAQRSYPSGQVDLEAYEAALNYRNKTSNYNKSLFDGNWESKGPLNLSGRITDIEMVQGNLDLIYAGSASGGIFKSEDRGQIWSPIFDQAKSLSIGDISIYNNDPNIIYAGTGESNAGGGSLAYDGQGVYRSDDAGESWKELGPQKIGSIGKIVIDPNNADIVYIAAMGELFKNNAERGVYKTVDGGGTWQQTLTVSDSTGAIDLAIDPRDGNIIYAAMWERIRRPYNRQYGGKTSGVYKSVDGGATWNELSNGLPQEESNKGRIGLAISESHPDILYAYYANSDGSLNGVYKTEDAGVSWEGKTTENISDVPFIWWFGKIFVHPTNPDLVYLTSLNMFRSTNGGNNWTQVFADAHVDHHAMYLQKDFEFALNGNDGGIRLGESASMQFSTPLEGLGNFQFYTCEIDPFDPEIIYGGAQDNGTVKRLGADDNWQPIFGGDGFRVLVDPTDQNQVYIEFQYGNIFRSNNGGNSFSNATSGLTGQFNWNTPIAMDPNNSAILYTGAQSLFRTENFAEDWDQISDQLVNENNPTGNLTFGSLTTIDVSQFNSEVIYVGTDDGNVWVTTNQGISYNNISEGLPQRWISSISHDPHSESGVYVSVSGFRFGESESHIFYSDNYGQDWKPIATNLPDIPINDVVADDEIEGVIYAASDIGVFVTENNGDEWRLMGKTLPNTPITDIDLESNFRKLAVASYGRGIFTYDLPEMVSTKNIDLADLLVYPNPASDIISISSGTKVNQLSIFNLSGQILKTVYTKSELQVSDLKAGIYFLKIDLVNHKSVTEKITIF